MDDEKKMQKYAGYESLVKLGGFIGEKAQSLLYAGLPDEVCETPETFLENEDGTEEAVWADKGEGSFFRFRMVATAVCIRNPKYQRLQNFAAFKVSRRCNKLLMMLSQLEAAILWEYLGLGKSEAGSEEDISRKMDFCSTPAMIRQIMYRIESYFDGYPEEWAELKEYASRLRKGECA
jgi:hypothetical protein